MKLRAREFEKIQSGEKVYEIRLNDEKRQKLRVGDEIEFSKIPELEETILVGVVGLEHYASFDEMFDALKYHYPGWMKQEWVDAMYEHYTKEEEEKYGALAIKIEAL